MQENLEINDITTSTEINLTPSQCKNIGIQLSRNCPALYGTYNILI